jgi:hypothetical protein
MSIHTSNLVEIGKFQIIEAKKWKHIGEKLVC